MGAANQYLYALFDNLMPKLIKIELSSHFSFSMKFRWKKSVVRADSVDVDRNMSQRNKGISEMPNDKCATVKRIESKQSKVSKQLQAILTSTYSRERTAV